MMRRTTTWMTLAGILCSLHMPHEAHSSPHALREVVAEPPQFPLLPTSHEPAAKGEPSSPEPATGGVVVLPHEGRPMGKLFAAPVDPTCRPHGSAYSHIFCPLEVYLRTGPAFVLGGGRLDHVLDTGYAVEFGARGFAYSFDHTAAWVGSLGVDYQYNNAHDPTPSLLVGEPATLRELNRVSASIAGGRQWYFAGETAEAPMWLIGVDVGGRLGHVHAKFIERQHQTDGLIGVFVGADAGVFISRRGYDILLGGRLEWGHEWFDIIDNSDDLGHLKILLTAGLRY